MDVWSCSTWNRATTGVHWFHERCDFQITSYFFLVQSHALEVVKSLILFDIKIRPASLLFHSVCFHLSFQGTRAFLRGWEESVDQTTRRGGRAWSIIFDGDWKLPAVNDIIYFPLKPLSSSLYIAALKDLMNLEANDCSLGSATRRVCWASFKVCWKPSVLTHSHQSFLSHLTVATSLQRLRSLSPSLPFFTFKLKVSLIIGIGWFPDLYSFTWLVRDKEGKIRSPFSLINWSLYFPLVIVISF